MNWRLMMLSAPLFAPFSVPIVALASVISVNMNQKEDGTHELTLTAPVGAAWLEEVKARRVIWVWIDGEVTEWMISRKVDQLGDPTVTVFCDPLHRLLADLGIIEHVEEPGAVPVSNLRGRNGNPENYQYSYSLRHLERRGVDSWIGIGDNDFAQSRLTFSFDGLTVWGLTITLKEKVMGVARLRRDEYERKYLIDILESFVQAGAPEFWLSEGRNLLRLTRDFQREQLRTTVRPQGDVPVGEEQRASIAWATFPVLAVVGDVLTVGRHRYEDDATQGPIWQAGQFADVLLDGEIVYPGQYAEAPDGTCWKIVDTAVAQTIEVETGGGASFAPGDDLRIVADADGTGMTEIPDPIGIQEAAGPVQGPVEFPLPGHRNYVRNPAWRFWGDDAPPDCATGQINGSPSGTTSIPLDNLELADGTVPTEIREGDDLHVVDAGGVVTVDRIAADVAVVAGACTVTLATARSWSDNTHVFVHLMADRTPEGWDRLPANVGHATPHLAVRSEGETITGELDGAHAGHTADGGMVSLRGLSAPAGTVIPAGSLFTYDSGGLPARWILGRGLVDGAGEARVPVYIPSSASDGAGITILTPPIGGGGFGYVPGQFTSPSSPAATLSQDFFVKYTPGLLNRLWLSVDVLSRSALGSGWSANPPRAIIANSVGTEIVGLDADLWSPSAPGETFEQILRVAHEIVVSTSLKSRFRWQSLASLSYQGPWTWPRTIQVHLGMDSGAAFVDGAAAEDLFFQGQAVLAIHAQWGATYRAAEADLASWLGVEVSSGVLAIGSVIRLNAQSRGERNVLLRVVGLEVSRENPVRQIILGSAPRHFVDHLRRGSRRTVWVDVDVTVVDGQATQTVLASEEPPPRGPGFEVPDGGASPGPLPVGGF